MTEGRQRLGEPLISVLTPAYNAAPFIEATVESALRQTFDGLEVLLIDDGSSDDTLERVNRIRDPRLVVIQQAHKGAPAALNCALNMARGKYVAFLDHDDLWIPSKLERHLEAFRREPALTATFSWYGLIDRYGNRIHVATPRWRGPITFQQLLSDFVVGSTSSLVIRRTAVLEAGGFDARFPRCHDFDLLLRISLRHDASICAVPEELTLYRRHSGQMSRDWRSMHKEWNDLIEKMRELSPQLVADAEPQARSNISRYWACLAYEEEQYTEASALLRRSMRAYPRAFLLDWRNWRIAGACCSSALLPRALHHRLEKLAGVRRSSDRPGRASE